MKKTENKKKINIKKTKQIRQEQYIIIKKNIKREKKKKRKTKFMTNKNKTNKQTQ